MNSLNEIKKYINELALLCTQSDEDTKLTSLNLINDLVEDINSSLLVKLEDKQLLLQQQQRKIIDEFVLMTTSNLNGKILEITQAYLDFTGYTKEEVIGQNHNIFRNQDFNTDVIKNLWDTILANKTWEGDLKNNKSTGEEYWIHAIIKPFYDINNKKIGYMSIKKDITTQKRLEEISIKDNLTLLHNRREFEYYIKKELTRSTFQQEHIALLLIEVDYYQKYKNKYGVQKAHKLLLDISNVLRDKANKDDYEIFKLSEKEFSIVILNESDSFVENFANTLLRLIEILKIQNTENKTSKILTLSIGVSNIDTKKHYLSSNDLFNISDANLTKAKQLGGNNTVIKISKKYIEKLKNIDNITKLPNRNVLVHDLSILKNEAMLILLHINQLDSLKNIYGFEFSKQIVLEKVQELKSILNNQETTLYTLNLHEFAVLITDKNLFDKYFLLLKHSILMSDNCQDNSNEDDCLLSDFTAGVSYGIKNIFNHADIVLQEALISHERYKIYKMNLSEKQLQKDTLNRLKVYKNALQTGKIIPYFQPIINAKDMTVMKYEALARIETESGEIIAPYYFLDSAKKDKTFEYFTRQMMQKVFIIFDRNNVNISINLTYENLNSETMINYIKNRLDKYGGDGITFELLESEEILNYEIVENFILMVKEYGCKISIDDFGSGYSNFTNIIKLNIDYIKLDGSLIEKLNTDENVKNMVKGLLIYAKSANIETVAEYVTSKELADTVKELGIDYLQGYYYGKPQAPEYYGLI